jgi:hypothetical protein
VGCTGLNGRVRKEQLHGRNRGEIYYIHICHDSAFLRRCALYAYTHTRGYVCSGVVPAIRCLTDYNGVISGSLVCSSYSPSLQRRDAEDDNMSRPYESNRPLSCLSLEIPSVQIMGYLSAFTAPIRPPPCSTDRAARRHGSDTQPHSSFNLTVRCIHLVRLEPRDPPFHSHRGLCSAAVGVGRECGSITRRQLDRRREQLSTARTGLRKVIYNTP